jgi:hypothetical protein
MNIYIYNDYCSVLGGYGARTTDRMLLDARVDRSINHTCKLLFLPVD